MSIRVSRTLANISAMNSRTLIRLFWLPGNRNPADLSSKTHSNLAKVVNSSYYRNGHASYANEFPCEQSVLFATMLEGVYKFRGLSSLANHTSHCYYCCSKYGREVAGILVYHTQILAGTGEPVTTDHPSDGYEAILTDANTGMWPSLLRGRLVLCTRDSFLKNSLTDLVHWTNW